MNNRIKNLRKELHLSQEAFAKKLGMKGAAISLIESGNRNLTEQVTKSICREFNVDYIWLTTGEGEMFSRKDFSAEIINTVGERLKHLRTALHLSQPEFSYRLSLEKSSISLFERNQRKPTNRIIKDICREFNVNHDWLTTGEGEIFSQQNNDNEVVSMVNEIMNNKYDFRKDLLKTFVHYDSSDWEALEKIIDLLKTIKNK